MFPWKLDSSRRVALALVLVGCGGPTFSAIPDASDDEAAVGADASKEAVSDAHADATAPGDGGGAEAASGEAGGDAPGSYDAAGDGGQDAGRERDARGDDGASDDGPSRDAAPEDASEDHEPRADASEGGIDASDAGALDASEAGAVDAAEAGEACSPVVYFLDGDSDGYGGTSSVQACAPPDAGAWVTVGGDCDDSNAAVNPGQTAYFSTGYVPAGKTSVSFDYDCDGVESESGSAAKAACAFSGLSCVGSGYVEATPVRSGAGVDAYCGSDDAVTCSDVDSSCQAGTPYGASPIACH